MKQVVDGRPAETNTIKSRSDLENTSELKYCSGIGLSVDKANSVGEALLHLHGITESPSNTFRSITCKVYEPLRECIRCKSCDEMCRAINGNFRSRLSILRSNALDDGSLNEQKAMLLIDKQLIDIKKTVDTDASTITSPYIKAVSNSIRSYLTLIQNKQHRDRVIDTKVGSVVSLCSSCISSEQKINSENLSFRVLLVQVIYW